MPNFDNICKTVKSNNPKEEIHQSACAIIDVILSDAEVAKILTTKRLNALQYIFATLIKYNINNREVGIGIPILVKNLYYNKESFFYKHINREGLALPLNIYDSIFDSPELLSNFNLFAYPSVDFSMRKEIDMDGLNVIIEALSRSIKTYLKTAGVFPRHINDGLEYLSDIFGDLCLKISAEEFRGIDTKYSLKNEWVALYKIAEFLGHDYPFIAYQDELNQIIIEREKATTEVNFYSDSTINAGISAALYKAFEQLSYIENTTETYSIILKLLHGMMYENNKKEGYRSPFEKRIWEQIASNILQRYYPAVLKIYLEFIGYCLATEKDKKKDWLGEQTERMRRLLYVDLKPLIDTNARMINNKKLKDALLPTSMDYRDGKFIYRFKFGEVTEKDITPPIEEEALSALKGVNLDHPSLV